MLPYDSLLSERQKLSKIKQRAEDRDFAGSDPYRKIQESVRDNRYEVQNSREFREKIVNDVTSYFSQKEISQREDGSYGISEGARQLTNRRKRRRSRLETGKEERRPLKSGFIPRPGSEEYSSLFNLGADDEKSELTVSYFQLQQREQVQNLMSHMGKVTALTQKWDIDSDKDSVSANILAPNMLTKSIAERINDSAEVITTSKEAGTSFHPKMGYTKTGQGSNQHIYAFIGTQNITPALDKNNTLESLLVLDAKLAEQKLTDKERNQLASQRDKNQNPLLLSSKSPLLKEQEQKSEEENRGRRIALVESSMAQEVIGLTDDLIATARGSKNQFFSNVALREQREKRKTANPGHSLNQSFTVYNEQILQEYNDVLDIAARESEDSNSKENRLGKVYLSINRMDALLSSDNKDPRFQAMKKNLKRLSEKGKLSLVTDRETYSEFINSLDRKEDKEFLRTLTSNNSITFNALKHHEKGIGITDREGNLVYMGKQSANITQSGMWHTKENLDQFNTETMVKVSSGFILEEQDKKFKSENLDREYQNHRYRSGVLKPKDSPEDLLKEKEAYQEYLNSLGFKEHMQVYDSTKFNVGYKTEEVADSDQLKVLENKLKGVNEQVEGKNVFEIERRYAPGNISSSGRKRDYDEAVGLRVRVKPSHSGVLEGRGIEIDLTVNEEGRVLISDENKVVGDTLLQNQSSQSVNTPTGDTLRSKETKKLGSKDTVVGLLTTLSSELGFQNRYRLTRFQFNEFANRESSRVESSIDRVLSQSLVSTAAEQGYDLLTRDKELPNLTQIINSLPTDSEKGLGLKQLLNSFVDIASTRDIATGQSIETRDIIERRRRRLQSWADQLLAVKESSKEENKAGKAVNIASKLLSSDTDQTSIDKPFLMSAKSSLLEDSNIISPALEDFRASVISNDSLMESSFFNALQSQALDIKKGIFDPFLSTHDNQTSFMQQKANLPFYAIREERLSRIDNTRFGQIARIGFMDPGDLSHSTQLEPGRYQRPIAANAIPNNLPVGGFGGMSNVKVVNADLHTGAAKVFDMHTLMKGVSGYGMVTMESQAEEMASLEIAKGKIDSSNKESRKKEIKEQLKGKFTADVGDKQIENIPLYLIPYNKTESITQRFKNVTGARPATDIDLTTYQKLMGEGKEWSQDDIDNLHAGEIRKVLPELQFEKLKQEIKKFKQERNIGDRDLTHSEYRELTGRLRNKDMEPLNQDRGIVGPSKLKRMALHSGFSLMGDTAYYNAGYRQPVGETKRLRLTLGLSQVDSVDHTVRAIQEHLNSSDIKVIGSKLEDGGMYKWIKEDESKEGYWEKIGHFTDTGLIELKSEDLYKTIGTNQSPRKTPITLKFGAYGKGMEGGVSVFRGGLNFERNSRGTLIAEQDVVTVWEPSTGSRSAAGGQLPKMPQVYTSESVFEEIQGALDQKERLKLSSGSADDKIYSLGTFSQFKGFTSETGLSLIADEQSRRQIIDTDSKVFTRSLAMLFLGDDEIRKSLSDNLRSENSIMADALLDINKKKAFDLSSSTGSLSIIAQGLSYLNNEADSPFALEELKQKVKSSLQGDQESARELAENSKELVKLIAGESEGNKINNGEGTVKLGGETVITESSMIHRSGGLLAHMMHFSKQLFESTPISVGGLYDAKALSPEEYIRIRDKGSNLTREEKRKKDFTEFLAASSNIKLSSADDTTVKRRLTLLREAQERDVVLETYSDNTPSKTLVSSGQKDEVNFEFHYFLGLSKKHIDKFKDQVSDEAKYELYNLQEAYTTLTAAVGGGFHKNRFNSIDIKLPFSVQSSFDSKSNESTLSYWALKKIAEENNIPIGDRNDDGVLLYELINNYNLSKSYLEQEVREKIRQRKLHTDQRQINIRLASTLYNSFLNQKARGNQKSLFKDALDVIIEDSDTESAFEELRNKVADKEESGYRADIYKQYLHGLITTHKYLQSEIERLQKEKKETSEGIEEQRRLQNREQELYRVKEELRKSQQIVIPNIETKQIQPGSYQASIKDLGSADKPTVGVLMGNDLLQKVRFVETLSEAQPILDKLNKYGTVENLTEYEIRVLDELQQNARATSETLLNQVTNEKMRQAAGDHETFTGAVGYAVDNFALASDEAALGERFTSLSKDLEFEKIIKQKSENIASINDEFEHLREVRQLSRIIEAVDPSGKIDSSKLRTELTSIDKEVNEVLKDRKELNDTEKLSYRKSVTKAYFYQKLLGHKDFDIENQEYRRELNHFLSLFWHSEEKDEERLQKYDRQINLKVGGVIRRTGMPAGGFAGLETESTQEGSEELGSSFLSVEQLQQRVEGKLIPDEERSSSAMFVSPLGTTVAGLGDFDGDSFQLLLAQAGRYSKEVSKRQSELDNIRKKKEENDKALESLNKAIEETANEKELQRLRGKVQDIYQFNKEYESRINEKNRELEKSIGMLQENRLKLEDAQTKQMENIRNWIKNFTSLPDFAFSERVTTPEAFTYISQKFDTGGIEDANYIKEADKKIELFGSLIEDEHQQVYEERIKSIRDESNEEKRREKLAEFIQERINQKGNFNSVLEKHYGKEDEQVVEKATDNVLDQLQKVNDDRDLRQQLTEYYALRGNLQTGLESFLGQLDKAEGNLLNPYDFEAIQTSVGEAGSKLIGSAYNTLIPLLERSMFEQGVMTAIQANKESDSILENMSSDLKENMADKEFQEKVNKRYQGTLSTITAFQQLVRDALKPKEGSDLREALKGQGYTRSIAELEELKTSETSTAEEVREKEHEVQEQLREALQRTAGFNINSPENEGIRQLSRFMPDSKYNDYISRRVGYDKETTAFGAILDLADFTKTKDPNQLEKQFLDERNLREDFANSGENNLENYLADRMVEMVERTEAVYKSSTLTDEGVNNVIEEALAWSEKEDTEVRSKELKTKYQELVEGYKRAIQEEGRSENLDKALVTELQYATIRERNRETGAFNRETVKMLREQALTEQEFKEAESGQSTFEDKMRKAKTHSINVSLRRMMRGHVNDPSEAVHITNFQYQALDIILKELGYNTREIENLSEKEKAELESKVRRIMPMGAFEGLTKSKGEELSEELTRSEINEIIGIVSGIKDDGSTDKSGYQTMKDSTAATSRYFALQDQMADPRQSDEGREYISDLISNITERGKINVEEVSKEIEAEEIEQERYEELINQVKEQQQQVRRTQSQEQRYSEQGFRQSFDGTPPPPGNQSSVGSPENGDDGIFFRESALEGDIFGTFSSAALFGLLASDEKPEEERLGMFAFDSLMGLAEVASSNPNGKQNKSWTRALLGDQTDQAQNKFRRGRIQNALRTQDSLEEGIGHSFSQELISEGFGRLAQEGIERMMPKQNRPRGATAMAGVATEVLANVFSRSASRAITGAKDATGAKTQEFLGRFVHQYIEQTWKLVEQIQEAALNSQNEVIDTDHNNNISFETEITDLEWDIKTGLIVLDKDEVPLEQVFDGINSEPETGVEGVEGDNSTDADLMSTVDTMSDRS